MNEQLTLQKVCSRKRFWRCWNSRPTKLRKTQRKILQRNSPTKNRRKEEKKPKNINNGYVCKLCNHLTKCTRHQQQKEQQQQQLFHNDSNYNNHLRSKYLKPTNKYDTRNAQTHTHNTIRASFLYMVQSTCLWVLTLLYDVAKLKKRFVGLLQPHSQNWPNEKRDPRTRRYDGEGEEQ